MKTTAEILETWETEGQYQDWYAVDSFDARTQRVHRLFVGDAETACKMASGHAAGSGLVDYEGNPAEPGWDGNALFYRATLIHPKSARDYMLCLQMHDAPEHSGELITVAAAAEELGITRQSCYELVRRGSLPSEDCDGVRVGRYSVALRNAAKSSR